ncbi:MAG: hypothetical protein JST12_17055 [Armatimonadetes bacterium]|nr:hypothetical protein [Armatimonadota bacterium]
MMMVIALAMTTACMAPLAHAQGDILDHEIKSAEYQNADLREVLKTIFKEVNASYSIPPDIQGSITLSMKNAKFELVLQNVLGQVDATYRYEGGVFVIVKRESTNPIPTDNGDTGPKPTDKGKIIRKIYIRSADPALIAMLLSSSSQQYNGSPEPTSISRMGSSSGFGGGGFGSGSGGFGSGSGGFGGGFGGGGFGGGSGGFGGGGFGGGGFGGGGFGGGGFGGGGGGRGGFGG